MIGQVMDAVSFMEKQGGVEWIGVAGHSMGAMIGLLAAHEDPRIRGVAFIAGSSQAARVRDIFPIEVLEQAEKEGESQASVYGRDIKLRREFLLDTERYNVGHAMAMLNRPILIVHGSRDEIIAPHHARQLFNWASGPKSLEMIEGADHLFRNDPHLALMRTVVSSWFSRNL